jgi:hypothetical protein
MIRWHVIFHERLYVEHYASIDHDDILAHLRFVGVNERYNKTIPKEIPSECVVYEKDFPGYDPLLQMCRYYESSVMFHMYRCPHLLEGVEYVGFCQYDMNFPRECMNQIKAIDNSYENTVMATAAIDPRYLFNGPLTAENWQSIIDYFNVYHNTNYTIDNVMSRPIVLFHSFGMHVKKFMKMMAWINSAQPLMLRLLQFDKTHLCGTIERLYGIYITLHHLKGTFDRIIMFEGMEHLNDKKFQDPAKSFLL